MDDLISRRAAIDAVESMLRRKFGIGGDLAEITLAGLPSVQPDHNADIGKKVEKEDCISRQAAIDALHTWFRDGFDEDKWWNSTHVLAAIEGLPSAQQGYKWETCFECPLSHGCPKIKGCTNEQAIEYASQIPNDCPLSAQPEQHWIPCSEKLPEYNESVLTWDGYIFCIEKRIPYIRDDDGEPIEGDWWVSDEYDEYESEFYPNLRDGAAIAWMPLPEPYRGGDSE